ncbi:MAG TPA: hypothetical protein P5291_05015, partial [Flavobacteriales bacterium]|nr:hypothetical protein [Flavobacteriales bacterium]
MKHLIHFRALPLLAVPWLIGTGNAAGQNVSVMSGTVQGRDAFGKREPVPFAFVAAMGQAASTSADQLGHFKLEAPLSFPLRLVASAVGYANDTLFLEQPSTGITLTLPEVIELRATEVIERQAGTRMDLRATQGNERIQRTHHPNGAVRREQVSDLARRERSAEREFSESGTKLSEVLWQEGMRASEASWYQNGQPRERIAWVREGNRRVAQVELFNDAGVRTFSGSRDERARPVGVHRQYDARGTLRLEQTFDDGGRPIRRREFDESG